MSLVSNIVINGFSILILVIICVHSLKRIEEKSLRLRMYIIMILTTILLLMLDVLSRTDGNLGTIYPFINHVSNFLLFLLNPILPSLWVMYVDFQVYHDEKKTERLIIPLLLLNAANAVMVIVSQFNGWYYFIDANNIYHRGPFFAISTLIIFILLIAAFAVGVRNRKTIDSKQLFSLLFFPVPPVVGIILQIFIYGISFALNSIVLSLLIVILNIKDDTILTDYLTGIGNRKKFESILKKSVRKSSKNKTFSLVMLDIDEFKEINDTFGHEMGDKALQVSADLLEKCSRSKDYVARFGGDEFCLLLDINDIASLEAMVRRIKDSVNRLNDSGEFPFRLKFAIGYAVYDYQTDMKAEDFVKHVDVLMYENKRRKNVMLDQCELPY